MNPLRVADISFSAVSSFARRCAFLGTLPLIAGLLLAFSWSAMRAEENDPAAVQAAQRKQLGPLQSFVGEWKGSGQVKRGSTEGAWREEASWAWEYGKDSAAVVFHSPDSTIYTSGRIRPGEKAETYQLVAHLAGEDQEATESFTGTFDDLERLVFTVDHPTPGRPAEIVVRLVARGRRLVMIYQKQSEATDAKAFMAEVGYSRKGSDFGRSDELAECVLTGGAATIAVTHKGKTYYVCCTGCRDYFVENPDKVLAEYQERLAERKKKAEQKQAD